jgi:alkyl hydroperoxide reductase subunit F
MLDVIIVGAGPAGITASVYASRKKMELVVISRDVGGQAAWSGDIENYTGYQFITGPELTDKFSEHLRRFDIALQETEEALDVHRQESSASVVVRTNRTTYEARTVIIASGKRSRELHVPGEKQFKNRGLTYCATCDGPFFSGKDVAVIGGGNSALDAALQLVKIASRVYVVTTAAELTGDKVMQEKLRTSANVSILSNTHVVAVLGDKFVSGIKVKKDAAEDILPVRGVFVEIGLIPNSEFVRGVEKNTAGEIKVDCRNQTSVSGIFAAGDVTDVPEKQIIIAAGEGAKALLSAFRYLMEHTFS